MRDAGLDEAEASRDRHGWALLTLAHQLLLEEVAHAGDIHRSLEEVSAGWVCTLDRL